MPYLHVNIASDLRPDAADEVAAVLTELTATVLGKKRELTAVAITLTPGSLWYVGGTSLAGHDLTSFYLDIKVTEGTNTKNEKAAYAAKVFDDMTKLLGPLAAASYIVIHEVHADAWGYEGQTQEFRYIKGKAM